MLLLSGQAASPVAQPRTETPDARFTGAFAQTENWVGRAYPGAVLAIGQRGRLLAIKAFGRMEVAEGAPPMPADAIFDLASLTKVIATTSAAAILYDRGKLDLDAPVQRYLSEFIHPGITVRHLLTHSSGLKPSGVFWTKAKDRVGILAQIYALPAGDPPGAVYKYQDFNIILIGEIVSRIARQPLDKFLQKNLFGPLGMTDTGFNPRLSPRIVPTEQDNVLRHALVRGVVHDENAYLMGGVAGHAGLFSTAHDLAKLAQLYLDGGKYGRKRIIRANTLQLFQTAQSIPAGSTRALGWDMPSANGWAGPLASPRAIIHTGFTGTSIYVDPDRDAYVILLTNRVNPTRDNLLINQARPAIMTTVLEALDKGK